MSSKTIYKNISCNLVSFMLYIIFVPFVPFVSFVDNSFAQDFTATTLGDYGNVTVMEVTGKYDANLPDGSINSLARKEIAKEFFRIHKDEYDFLVIFSNFDFEMPEGEAGVQAFYLTVKNDTLGIGQELFDNSALFGSDGKLQGTIDMGNVSELAVIPLEPEFEETLYILAHEVLHRWGAYVKFKDAGDAISDELLHLDLEKHAAHWSFLLDSDGSVLYGNNWQDNGDGTFTSIAARKYYSPLDLYLMGFYDRSQVPPMLLIENPDIDPARLSQPGATIDGTPRQITIDDIIAAEGERTPGPSESQKNFKSAFIYVTTPGTFTSENLYGIENIRQEWITRFSVLTDGLGMMEVASTQKEDLPTNPGITLPPVTPRTELPYIEDGVTWLMDNQEADGSWMDSAQTMQRDTVDALLALEKFDVARQNYSIGLDWLDRADAGNMVYLAKKIETLTDAGQDVTALLDELLSGQNPDGGWGSNKNYMSNPTDTSFVLKALAVAGYSEQEVVSKAIDYLKSEQNADGGWGSDDEESSIESTANVLFAFNIFRASYPLNEQITRGIAWLIQRQNSDHGFGNSPSTVYDTAIAIMTLRAFDVSPDIINHAIDYILDLQSENGSWYESPYQTALAVQAVWKATVDPDLSIKAEDITLTPSSVTSLPADIEIKAEIWNLGRTDVSQAKVILYDRTTFGESIVDEQIVSFLGQSSVTVTFSVTIADGDQHRFYVAVDSDNLVGESNESNNTALKVLSPESNYDFELSGISVSTDPVDFFQDVEISSSITNNGTVNAYNVQLRYFIDDSTEGPFDIATVTVDIPAGTTIPNNITWRANKAGDNLPIVVYADPFDLFAEVSETNNRASTSLTVNPSTEPNLTVSHEDMVFTPSPACEGGDVSISAIVKNEGFSPASNIRLDFYSGVPGQGGELLGSQTIALLDVGESSSVSADWAGISGYGEKIVYIQVDPQNQISEVSKEDNSAFATLQVLSLPDLVISTGAIVFNPPAPKEGDTVSIDVTVQNAGEQGASNVCVAAYKESTTLGSQSVTSIAANSRADVSFTYDTTGKPGPHEIRVVVDPDNAITEQSEANNEASRTFGVQDADLWVTESYISPNGDGVKDSTQFFFRIMDTPRTVTVAIVNDEGEAVRTFSGPEFENTTGGTVTWNGLDEDGMVVDDGQYQIQVTDKNGSMLAGLPVVVDNNRSSLTDAIGTSYLLHTDLTTSIPDIDYWTWFPDESGIIFHAGRDLPGYPNGLYKMSPDGQDITKIITWESLGLSYNLHLGFNRVIPSPDGKKVAIAFKKWNDDTDLWESELWVVDTDGRNLTLLDSDEGYYSEFTISGWSPDSSYIAYTLSDGEAYWHEWIWIEQKLLIIKPNGSEKVEIESHRWDAGDQFKIQIPVMQIANWSPDSKRIAYIHMITEYIDSSNWVDSYELKISDIMGNKEDLAVSSDYQIQIYEWLNDQKLIVKNYKTSDVTWLAWLIDTTGAGDHAQVGESEIREVFVSPDRQYFALKSFAAIAISDTEGNVCTPFASGGPSGDDWLEIGNVIWSPDSRKLAYIETYWHGDGFFPEDYGNLTIIDVKTNEHKIFRAFSGPSRMQTVKWLSDGISIVGSGFTYNWESGRAYNISLINSETGEITTVMPAVHGVPELGYDYHGSLVSPLERYLAYDNKAYDDLWTTTSLLNLIAHLRVTRDSSRITLKGVAQDLNFEGYSLEYADTETPYNWNIISPPSDIPVMNDVFTTWVPPYEGTFYVKLTLWDKAGNVAWDRKRVSWGRYSSITNIYKTHEIFSPNGDGAKDTVELHYRALEPVHLDFYVYDQDGGLVKTFPKVHTSPEEGCITWDGTDESGSLVPDGTYTFQIFDYTFFVDVDNTPPEVGLSLSPIDQATNLLPYVDMHGHAVDKNLKHWVIEWGEGHNPQQYYNFVSRDELLVARDADGNPILDPIEDDLVDTLFDFQIEDKLVAKKFRITAEDFAGNRTTHTIDFLEESIIFYKWGKEETEAIEGDFRVFDIEAGLITNTHAPTTLGILETIREEIASITIQYSEDGGGTWEDAETVDDPPSGKIEIAWDTAELDPPNFPYKVRVKAVDILRNEYYSNTAIMDAFKITVSCFGLTAFNAIEDLNLLKFQIQSDHDPDYFTWTDSKVYDAKEEDIPTGKFHPALDLSFLRKGISYKIKMVGTGVNNEYYESEWVVYPPRFCPEFTIDIEYEEARGCDEVSPGKATLIARMVGIGLDSDVTRRSLTYYVERPGGDLEILKSLDISDLSKDSNDFKVAYPLGYVTVSTTINTNTYEEGSYPIKGILEVEYIRNNISQKEDAEAFGELVVDRTLPASQITYPGESLLICSVRISDPEGDRYGIPIEGRATDNHQVKRYELYHDDMSIPVSGKGPVEGQLGIWDITNLGKTSYPLRLKVVDVAGNVSCYTTDFSVDNTLKITNLSVDPHLFSPDNNEVLDDVNVTYEINEYAAVDVKVFKLNKTDNGSYLLDSTPLRTIVSGVQHLGGMGSTVWDGRDDSGIVVPDGKYGITVFATDSCGIAGQKWVAVGVGNTATDETNPEVILTIPKEGELFGSNKSTISITGTIAEENLETYSLRYGSGDNPAQWKVLLTGNTLPADSQLFTWNVGKGDGVPDGLYTISLYAKDKAGLEGEARVRINIDNTAPLALITSPGEGSYVREVSDIRGTAFDQNLDNYTVEFSEGNCTGAFKWWMIIKAVNPAQDGVLARWQSLPPDGDYCLRLTAIDKVGNKAESKTNFKVDTRPPSAPVLSGEIENKSDAKLNWTQNQELDLAGYNIYRDGQKLNPEPVNDVTYLDQGPGEGVFVYTVTAVDLAGWESTPSNEVKITIDVTGPDAKISAPSAGFTVSGIVDIKGSAFSVNDFKEYRVYIGQGSDPTTWSLIRTSPIPISYGALTQWDTIGLGEEVYSIKLETEDISGNINSDQVSITIDNTPPAAPVLLSAAPAGLDVTVTWQANTEPDFAGYLLYRNDQLVNALGIVVGSLKSYLITDTTYPDEDMPDGTFAYYLVAMDEAGNISDQSNTIEVIIDTHPPQAEIVEPPDGFEFEKKILVRAESSDIDIASIQFQYKRAQDTAWIDLGGAVTTQPHITYLDPVTLGLTYGDYHLRAGATDAGGKTDPSPLFITVTYTDLTAPQAPDGVSALTNGGDVTLTWTANEEADLDGYNIYRSSGETKTKINASIVTETTYEDGNLADGIYAYEITAVDSYGNEGGASEPVLVKVYTLVLLEQPNSPTGQGVVRINGGNAASDSSVEIFADTGTGPIFQGTTAADSGGNFMFDVTLSPGENHITARATDSAGNVSKTSNTVTVVYVEPPAPAQDLTATASGPDIILGWAASSGPDMAGYNMYRDTSSGWVNINAELVTETTYTDEGLTSGTYTYRVTAVNSLDVESSPSNEASSSVNVPPSRPEIFLPPISEGGQVRYTEIADIPGSADPGITLELYKNGIAVAGTTASDTEVAESYTLDYWGEGASLSPDGKTLAYAYNQALWLMDLSSGSTTQIVSGVSMDGYPPQWSYDGDKLAYMSWDSNWMYRTISIYDVETGVTSPLSDDEDVNQTMPSWLSDGRIAFITDTQGSRDVWAEDLVTGSLTRITDIGTLNDFTISPDGTKLAYYQYPSLYIVDLSNDVTIEIETQAGWTGWGENRPDWSPDSKKLAFLSQENGNRDIYVLDTTSQKQSQITDSPQNEYYHKWYPDGKKIVFARIEDDWTRSVRMTSAVAQEDTRLIEEGLGDVRYLSATNSGEISYIDQNILNVIHLEGLFRFESVELDPGENLFHVIGTDSFGNVSDPSEEFCIIYDTGRFPDLEATTDDIFMYPPYPIKEDDVTITVMIRNKGQVEAEDVEVDTYLWDATGDLELVASKNILYMAPGAKEAITIPWDTTAKTGTNTVIVVVDPEDKISEVTETNNVAAREFFVAKEEGISMSTTLDSDQYRSSQDVNIDVNLRNSGVERDVVLEVWIEDGNGNAVTLLDTISTHLQYASEQNFSLAWNTGSTYAGPYRVHTLLMNIPDVVAENINPFTILPDIEVASTVVTDKTHYGPKEDVVINFDVKNKGENHVIPELNVKVRIVDEGNNELFTEDKKITNLLPGVVAALSSTWNTGLNLTGDYGAIVEIFLDDQLVSGNSAPFEIDASATITGTITVTPAVVVLGRTGRADYSIRNIGNTDVSSLVVKVLVTDPETQSVMSTYEDTIDLGMNDSGAGQFTFSTQNYELKTYRVNLQSIYQGSEEGLANKPFTVRDGTPPVVSIISPVSDTEVGKTVGIAALASDDASGVDKAEYQIDDGLWTVLPLSDVSQGRYATTWTTTASNAGMHTIRFRATDRSGNTSESVSTGMMVELVIVANDDDYSVEEDTTLNVAAPGVLTNDSGPGAILTAILVTPAGSGTVLLNSDGAFTYIPAPNFNGADTFTYSASADSVVSNTATVTITVSPVNDPPMAVDDNVGTDEETAITVDVLTNDTDVDSTIDQATVAVDTGPGNGLVSVDPGAGAITYTPNVGFTGTDSITYTVDDEEGATSNAAMVTITVSAVNRPPVANAGPDQNVETGTRAILDGSDSFDPDGDLIAYDWSVEWSIDSKPTDSKLTDADVDDRITPKPTFTPDVDGLYVFRLVVNDGQVDSEADYVEITAGTPNVPPNANAGDDRSAFVRDLVMLDGSTSYDPEGGPDFLIYMWTFKELPPESTLEDTDILDADQAQASFTPDVVGIYVLNLWVSDGEDSNNDEVKFTVFEANVPLNANAGDDITISFGETAILDGSASNDPDDGPEGLTYSWEFVSIPGGSALTNENIYDADEISPFFTPDVPGTYVIELMVGDGQDYDNDNVAVIVEPEGIEPEQTIFNLTARAKDSKIDIVWSAVAGTDNYNIYRSTTEGGPYTLVKAGHVTTYCVYADFGLTNDVTYYYVVTSVTNGVGSLNSNEASATPQARIRR